MVYLWMKQTKFKRLASTKCEKLCENYFQNFYLDHLLWKPTLSSLFRFRSFPFFCFYLPFLGKKKVNLQIITSRLFLANFLKKECSISVAMQTDLGEKFDTNRLEQTNHIAWKLHGCLQTKIYRILHEESKWKEITQLLTLIFRHLDSLK